MARKMRKVALLGAFEIQADEEPPLRDGLILGSRRERRGFVLETSRESIEQIVAAVAPREDLPQRLTASVGKALEKLGYTLMRVELVPLPVGEEEREEGYGAYVQGFLVFKNGDDRKLLRMAMTATEGIQVAIAEGLSMLADEDLLQLNVGRFLAEIDEFTEKHQAEEDQFHSFVEKVTASDFARFYQDMRDGGRGPESDEDPDIT